MRILLVDHHDSYTHILGHLLYQAGERSGLPVDVDIVAHDCPSWEEGRKATLSDYQLIVLSPGPGSPQIAEDVGISAGLLHQRIPLWGVCLGHQLMAVSHGANLCPDHAPHHGVVSKVRHTGTGLWEGIEQDTPVVRYHSLAVEEPLPSGVTATAWAEDGTVMALSYEEHGAPRWGVQFHPESIDTDCGVALAANVVDMAARWCDKQLIPPTEVEGVTALEIATLWKVAARPGETLRWLDDSASTGESIIALCGTHRWDPLRYPTAPFRSHYPHAGWVGVLSYEEDWVDFAHTEVVAWGQGEHWQVAGEDPARVAELTAELTAELSASLGRHEGIPVRATSCAAASLHSTLPISAVALSPAHYERSFAASQIVLACGESYEVCLTDVLHLPRALTRTPWEAYLGLRQACPTSFGAYLDFEEGPIETLISASPELFLHVTTDGTVTTRPMKGTSPRFWEDPDADAAAAYALHTDPKTRAENLMVIDMARSDLARVCQPGSVTVPKDRVVESYRTVHQLVTEVSGTLLPECTAVEALRACFPPASMTGAPKERTVEILQSLEAQPRGLYSGTLGMLGDDGSATFSVIIRSAFYDRAGQVSVGAGGAITVDSTCHDEYAEMLHKASYVVDAVLDPDAVDAPVVDSFVVSEGLLAQGLTLPTPFDQHLLCPDELHQLACQLHRHRFTEAVEELYGEDAAQAAAVFYDECLKQLPPRGEYFPQIRWGRDGGSAQLDRPCPPRLRQITAVLDPTPGSAFAELVTPRIKGPDFATYSHWRSLAQQAGAQEMVLLDRWGQVMEGTHSAILWWDGEMLCGPPQSAVMPSTQRQLLHDIARRQGIPVVERWLPGEELAHHRVWSVNALHGVREIIQWQDAGGARPD